MPNLLGMLDKATKPLTIAECVNDNGDLVVVMGHLGRDPEFRTVSSGKALVRFSVAVSWGKRGDPDQHTEWVVCQAWEDDVDMLRDFTKGQSILVIGKPRVRTYQGKEYGELTVWHVARPMYQRMEQRSPRDSSGNSEPDGDGDIPF